MTELPAPLPRAAHDLAASCTRDEVLLLVALWERSLGTVSPLSALRWRRLLRTQLEGLAHLEEEIAGALLDYHYPDERELSSSQIERALTAASLLLVHLSPRPEGCAADAESVVVRCWDELAALRPLDDPAAAEIVCALLRGGAAGSLAELLAAARGCLADVAVTHVAHDLPCDAPV